jgi:hypothetical protein
MKEHEEPAPESSSGMSVAAPEDAAIASAPPPMTTAPTQTNPLHHHRGRRFQCSLVPPNASTMAREEISLTSVQQDVYRVVRQLLLEGMEAGAGADDPRLLRVASLVSLDMSELASLGMEEDEEMVVSIITPRRGHHELYRRLELLSNNNHHQDTTTTTNAAAAAPPPDPPLLQPPLADVVAGGTNHNNNNTNNPVLPALIYELTGRLQSTNTQNPADYIAAMAQRIPRRVCQHPFRKNDIVWVCRTCQADETCVLCHACFSASDHHNHDVAFYHAQAGGCCDCGDPDGTYFIFFFLFPSFSVIIFFRCCCCLLPLFIIDCVSFVHPTLFSFSLKQSLSLSLSLASTNSLGSSGFLSPPRSQCRVCPTR